MGRFIVVVIDSFGIGYMDDVPKVRPQDIGANTCKHILNNNPNLNLQNFEDLGLINALGEEANIMRVNERANYGMINLAHHGGDTFMGHQELMGTVPKKPLVKAFGEVMDKVAKGLRAKGHKVEKYRGVLLVDNSVVVGDNLEADLGQVYNISGTFKDKTFEEIVGIGELVRAEVEVARVIAFGGEEASIEDILAAYTEKDIYAGIDTPKSGIYKSGFRVVHLGYGIDYTKQVPYILDKEGIKTYLFGKVADIVRNDKGINYEKIVDTDIIFNYALREIEQNRKGYFCINIQETDLAGHSQDVERYVDRLKLSDSYLGKLRKILNDDDILVVTADHGNDPTIGHSKHTRERVPLLLDKRGVEGIEFGLRDTLADIGASVLDYFGLGSIGEGRSFLDKLK